ncbi:DUF4352 domain-containing protein [Catellatospora sp. KI3]|uniref:DUF4352 domain-containing protein n=1 Tax=Catellatospora sp. KI3 TaxID=3041620 RepID=UPI002482E483|nr:DUF4352 domain-containing protein [Catellatospora sp. KI3]MDI1465017.1 DUF4352 domain-containing protein [Catellatospora sp. KI3]
MTNENYGPPTYPNGPVYQAAPPKKGLGTGGIIAIVVGVLILACCGMGTVIVLTSGDDTPDAPGAAAPAADAKSDPSVPAPSPSASSAPPPAEPDGPVTVKVGQAVNMKSRSTETRVTIKSVKKAKSDNQFTQPNRGQFVAVMVDILATKGTTDLGPTNFRLVATDGTVYQTEVLVVGIEPQLDFMTTVQQGQRKNGYVIFDVDPEKVAHLKVELSDDFGDPQGYWTT